MAKDKHYTGGAVAAGQSVFGAVGFSEFVLEFLGFWAHGQRILTHSSESGLIFGLIIDGTHEAVGDFELDAVTVGVAAGDSAFGITTGIVFVFCHNNLL